MQDYGLHGERKKKILICAVIMTAPRQDVFIFILFRNIGLNAASKQ